LFTRRLRDVVAAKALSNYASKSKAMQRFLPDPAPLADTPMVGELRVLVWAPTSHQAESLVKEASGPGRLVHFEPDDATAVSLVSRGSVDLLVAVAGPALEAQAAFIRVPLILLLPDRRPSPRLEQRAYAVIHQVSAVSLVIDRFLEHRQLAGRAAARREPPRQCARCGRRYDPMRTRGGGTANRFVRFGSISVCGACVEALRKLLASADTPYVEAELAR
jgi:hypothetical protein